MLCGTGRTLSTLQTSSVEINPDLPDAARLRKWRQGDGASAVTTTLSAASPSGPATDSDLRKEIGRLESDKVRALARVRARKGSGPGQGPGLRSRDADGFGRLLRAARDNEPGHGRGRSQNGERGRA